jgi:beta-glucanase (GH16 family)
LVAIAAASSLGACADEASSSAPSEVGEGGQASGGDSGLAGASSGGTSSSTGGAGSGGGPFAGDPALLAKGWELAWHDEFDGNVIDAARWEHEVNCWGGGNNEQQCYVADEKNSFVDEGMLHIVSLDDSPSGVIGGPGNDPTPVTLPYSSARLRTLGRADFKYGRMEARARLPYSQGLWPAFWMLPSDSIYGGWAQSGEIDIMEAVNLNEGANIVHGTLHFGGAWPANKKNGTSYEPATNVWENFHTYAIEWEEGEIRWFVDDQHFATQNAWSSDENDFPAPFDQEFHLLLNVAVGGNWPGAPDATTVMPQEMVVDFVRVYRCTADAVTGRGCGTSDPAIEPLPPVN